MGEEKLERTKGVEKERGKRALFGLREEFRGVVGWWDDLVKEVQRDSQGSGWGKLQNPFGRIRHLFLDDVPMICNFPPQSTAADILFDAQLNLAKALPAQSAFLCATVHDENLVEGPESEDLARVIKRAMEFRIKELGGIRIPVDIRIGRNWAKRSE